MDSRSIQLERQRKIQAQKGIEIENSEKKLELMESRIYQVQDEIKEDLINSKNFLELFTNLIVSIFKLFKQSHDDVEYKKALEDTRSITQALRGYPDFDEAETIGFLIGDEALKQGFDLNEVLNDIGFEVVAAKKIHNTKKKLKEAQELLNKKNVVEKKVKPD